MQKKAPEDAFFEKGSGGLVAVLLVVLGAADSPVPGLEGLLATRLILLRHNCLIL